MSPSRIEIRLLGKFEIFVDGRSLAPPTAKKARLLLGYLILRGGGSASRGQLGALLWPDSEDAVARFNLRQMLPTLRKGLGELGARLMSSDSDDIAFDGTDCWIDLREFKSKLKSNPREAVELYRGTLLQGLEADWLDAQRTELDQAYLQALETLADTSDPRESVGWLRKVVQADPYRESAQQKLIARLAECGDAASAKVAYRQFEDLLHREIHSSPSEETKRVLQEAISHQPAAVEPKKSSPPSNNLPKQLTSFVGREKEISNIKGLLSKTKLLTLTGAGGCGKTRLALQVASQMLDECADGVWIAELASLPNPDLVPQTVAGVFDLKEETGTAITQTLAEFLRTRRLLLLLDNCEHLLVSCARLADAVLRQCPQVVILATSREGLSIAGEMSYRVPSLSMPDGKKGSTPESLSPYESVRLFIERALFYLPSFTVTNENAPALASICNRLDGIPLAIELAAARVRSMAVEEVNQKLDQRFRLLTGGSRMALPRQQTLRSLIDWSYDLLSEPEKALLRRVSVFSGGWNLEDAEGVCGGEGVEEFEVLDLLTSLIDKSLVTTDERGGATRYRLLETVRQYARDRLAEGAEDEEWRNRHLAHFLSVAETAEPHLTGADQRNWLERLEADHDNLRSALVWSTEDGGDAEGGMRLAGAIWRFWQLRGYFGEGRSWLSAQFTADPAGRSWEIRSKALNGAGMLATYQCDYETAQRLHEQSLAMRRALGDRSGISASLNNLGLVACENGDLSGARRMHEESLAIKRELGDQWGIAMSLNNLGDVAAIQKDFPEARHLYQESLTKMRELGDKWGLAMALTNLGNVASELGESAVAQSLFEESLEIDLELGERRNLAFALEGLAFVALSSSACEAAAKIWGGAERLREEIGAPLPPSERPRVERQTRACRTAFGDEAAFDGAWKSGRDMTLEQVIDLARCSEGSRLEEQAAGRN